MWPLSVCALSFEAAGGFIRRPMYERLLVAEYVVADLTLANANVMYEVGVRHGSRAKRTLLVCAGDFVDQLFFDFKPLRVLTYPPGKAGHLSDSASAKLREALKERLHQALAGDLPPDNPILQVTALRATESRPTRKDRRILTAHALCERDGRTGACGVELS